MSDKTIAENLETQTISCGIQIDKVREAHRNLQAHYCECKQCGQRIHYRIGQLCERGEKLHEAWETEFYDRRNWQ